MGVVVGLVSFPHVDDADCDCADQLLMCHNYHHAFTATTFTSSAPESSLETIKIGTFDLLDLLTKEEPDAEFTFCMGADTFMDLTNWKWKRSKDVLRLLEGRIVVFQRQAGGAGSGGHDNDDAKDVNDEFAERVSSMNEKHEAQVQIVRLEISGACDSVSSTKIRSIHSREDLKGLVVPQIEEFIVQNQLYGFSKGDSV